MRLIPKRKLALEETYGAAMTTVIQHTHDVIAGVGLPAGKLATGALAAGTVTSGKIDVFNTRLADDSVTSVKIAALAVSSVKIAAAAVTATKIASSAVEEAKIAADAVTAAKIAVSGLDGTTGDVAANHIVANMLQTDCVVSAKIQADSVTAPKINVVGLNGTTGRIVVADATDANVVTAGVNSYATTLITAGKIVISGATNLDDWRHASDTTLIDGGDIYTGSVTATQITVATLSALTANVGTLTSGTINGVTIYAGASDVILDTSGVTVIGEKIFIADSTPTTKCTIGYDSVTDKARIVGQDTTDILIEGNANTVIITGGGRMGKVSGVSRAIDTVYRNTSDYLLHVQWSFVLSPGDQVTLLADDNASPSTVRARVSNDAGNADDIRNSISEIILNDEYYEFDIAAGTPTVSTYREVWLFGDPA